VKATNNFLRRAGLALLALLTVAGTYAFTFTLNDGDGTPQNPGTGLPIKWPAGTVPIRIMLGDNKTLIDGTNYNTSARSAAQAWNAILGSAQIQSTLVAGTAGTAGDNNDNNELAFSDKIFGKDFGADTLAVTTGYSLGNERVEADIIFNTAYTWDSYRGNTRANLFDVQRVALHELGHLLGLSHPDEADPKQSVSAIMNSRIGNLETLTTDDTNGAQSLYGPPGTPGNDAFANATIITLTSGNTTSLKGYNTNATREASEPLNASNSGGRSVWWRWTAPSSGSVTLDTKGSYYDTTLGVYTGSAVSSLTQIASDDDIEDGVVQASELTFNVTGGTTYRFSVDGFNSNDGSGADNAGITLNLAFNSVGGTLPSITTQPANVTVNSGASASFTVAATGTEPFSYQWQLGGTAISGATSASYSIASATSAHAGNYSVVVTNAAGSVTSNTATLTVNTPAPPPPPPSSGGGGGGGAPSLWFVAALVVLGFIRRSRSA
jgi:hypothetical protein